MSETEQSRESIANVQEEETSEDKEKKEKEAKLKKEATKIAAEWIKQGKKSYDFYTGLKVPKFRKGTREFSAPTLQGTHTYEEDERAPGWSGKRLKTEAINLTPEDLIAHIAEQAGIEKNDELYGGIESMIAEELQKIDAQQRDEAAERRRKAEKEGINEGLLREKARRIADEWRGAGLTAEQFHFWNSKMSEHPPKVERTRDPRDGARYRTPEKLGVTDLISELLKEAKIPDILYDDVMLEKMLTTVREEIQKGDIEEKIKKM